MKTSMHDFLNTFKNKCSGDFILRCLAFFFLVFILDYSTGRILKYYYFKQNSGFLYRTTYALEKTTADLLIFGASKANHQYYPEIFEKELKLPYFNVGRDGSSIFYHYAVLKSIFKRYTPKMIILDTSNEFEKTQRSYDRISMLSPYYDSHPEIRPIIELKSPNEKYKFVSRIYSYNSLLFSMIMGNSDLNKDRFNELKGYVPLSGIWNDSTKIISVPASDEFDSTKIEMYRLFIKACIDADVKLYIVCSPDFHKLAYVERSNLLAKKIAESYNIEYLDFSNDTLLTNNVKYFADNNHLNSEGAKVFSRQVVDSILKDNCFK